MIKDWELGSLDEDRTQHERLKREMKGKIVELSLKHSIVTQFTSFVAIEKRESDEAFDVSKGPSIDELVSQENVDILDYMAYDEVSGKHELQQLPEFDDALQAESSVSSASSYGSEMDEPEEGEIGSMDRMVEEEFESLNEMEEDAIESISYV